MNRPFSQAVPAASAGRRLLETAALAAAALLLFCAPLFLSDFRLNLLAKFFAFAIVAIGLDLLWGYTGILSLGHGVFFGLGAYCMAMYLKLEASGGKLPDFMSWSGVNELPWFWEPFRYPAFAMFAGIAVPVALAFALGWFTFRNRVRGVYFTILTQALAIITVTLFVGQQGYTGGTNGITGYKTVLGFPLNDPAVKQALYEITLLALIAAYLLARFLVGSRTGKVLKAIRDAENRVRFLGFDPARYQLFVLCLSAGLAGLAGMLYVLHVGIISPTAMGIVPSIEMVLWVALGGRGTLIGAVLGALAVNAAKSGFSETMPEGWLYLMGALFVIVVLLMPKGLAGLAGDVGKRIGRRRLGHERTRAAGHPVLRERNRKV